MDVCWRKCVAWGVALAPVGCGASLDEASALDSDDVGVADDSGATDSNDDTPIEDEGGEADADAGQAACDDIPGDLVAPEGAFIAQDDAVAGNRPFCEGARHATAGAEGSTLSVHLTAWEGDEGHARVRVEDLVGVPLVDWTDVAEGDALPVTLDRSGEVIVRLEPNDPLAASNQYALRVTCAAQCGKEFTRYPVVLMHGMAGTDTYVSVLDYWFRLEDHLHDPGYLVEIPTVDAFESTVIRAGQWREHLDSLVSAGVGRRFNLIAHSQGGLDARYLAAELDPERRVASVVTIATPHRGTAVADLATGAFDQFPITTGLVESTLELLGGLLGLSGSALADQVADLSRPAMEVFNAQILDVDGVYYASWAGRSCGSLDLVCQAGNHGEVVESVFGPTLAFLSQSDGPSDGLVPVHSAQWGEYMGELPADHMDEVGQIADVFNPAFDHRAFYLGELRRLAELGL